MYLHLEPSEKHPPQMAFALSNVKAAGEEAPVLVRAIFTSDNADFHKYMNVMTAKFLSYAKVFPAQICNFLVVLHADNSGDIFINEVDVSLDIKIKVKCEKGEALSKSDIADIKALHLLNVSLKSDDAVILCLKVDWKFLLFFDFRSNRNQELDQEKMSVDLANVFRRLSYSRVYEVLESQKGFATVISNGWFPFIEIIPLEFEEIHNIYVSDFDVEARVKNFLERFDEKRVTNIMSKWWANKAFATKEKILKEGAQAYFSGQYGNCIKNFCSELEGMIRLFFFNEKNEHHGKDFLEKLTEMVLSKEGDGSLLLPRDFLLFLKETTFRNFSFEDGSFKSLSRHTASHGVADEDSYTKEKAIQLILTLDQLFFYLN